MEHRQHLWGMGPLKWFSRTTDRGAGTIMVDWTRPQGRVRTSLASPDTTEMASTMVRTAVAMRRWLNIVGAERIGRTAVSHRHG